MNGFEKARRAANLSQKKAASLVGVTQPTISDYESGVIAPSIPTLIVLCDVYKTTPNILLDYGGDSSNVPLDLSAKAIKIARRWDLLSEDGQDKVSSLIIDEERIMRSEQTLPPKPRRLKTPDHSQKIVLNT
jgi:transcriptional regulator with XRE-family HTH domain